MFKLPCKKFLFSSEIHLVTLLAQLVSGTWAPVTSTLTPHLCGWVASNALPDRGICVPPSPQQSLTL